MSFNDLEQGLNTPDISGVPQFETSSISDDREYKQLTQRIAQQIFHINGNISSIQRLIGFLGGQKDTVDIRGKLHDVTNSTRELIRDTTKDLKLFSLYIANDQTKNRQRRLEQKKLSKDFQDVLSSFQKAQILSADKQREYVDRAKATTAMLQSQSQDHDSINESHTYQQQELLDTTNREIEYNELMITERENEIENIEQGISELNEIFRDMNTLVNEQETGIQSIYGNVFNITQHTKAAADELTIASRYQNNSRAKYCFLLLIMVVSFVLALIITIAK